MSGVQFHIHLDDEIVQRHLDELRRRAADPKAALKDIGEYMLADTQDRYRTEKDAKGEAWVEHSPWTKLEKKHPKKLQESGRLFDSLTYQVDGDRVLIGTNVVYGAIHQEGGDAGKNKKVYIPARPYLGISDENRAEILLIVADHFGDLG